MKRSTIILFFVFLSNFVFSQNFSGKVLNDFELPLRNVYLQNKRSKAYTYSNETGVFNLQDTKIGDSVRVRLLGYKSIIVVNTGSYQDIKLNASNFQLNDVVVSDGFNPFSSIESTDLQSYSVNSAQGLLRKVPGLIIGQHAGGGMAEQLFLRGFDLDHGTDLNISVDGVPVNLVSSVHAQGYADLNFLIPETVDKIEFDKGSYRADKGNFAVAGSVDFKTKDYLDQSVVSVEAGKFKTFRALGLFNLVHTKSQSAYVGLSYLKTDGPFDVSEDFNRLNLMAKYGFTFSNADKLSFSALYFNSKWNASGQIPERAVKSGSITRFGSMGNNDGGATDKLNLNFKYDKFINNSTYLKTNAFYVKNNIDLYTNTTFYLKDPINGDQLKQKEARNLFGIESVLNKKYYNNNSAVNLQIGLGLRYDFLPDLELSHSLNRDKVLAKYTFGKVNELNPYLFLNTEIDLGKLILNPGLRVDIFNNAYQDLIDIKSISKQNSSISPKLNFFYNENKNLQFYLKLGKGFHSNDSRVAATVRSEFTLPASYGMDFGTNWKPLPQLLINAAVWYVQLEKEFVFDNELAAAKMLGRTKRSGLDISLKYQINTWLTANTDLTWSKAKAIDSPEDYNYIPLSIPFTFTGGLNIKKYKNFFGGLNGRYVASRPANEGNTLRTKAYFIVDGNLNYVYKQFTIGLVTENILNQQWNETQLGTDSKLKTETTVTNDINFIAGTPFNIRGSITYRF